MTTLKHAKQIGNRVKKHAELMKKLCRDEGMTREEASQVAYKLLLAQSRRKITAKMKAR